jgi:hypothetical protein
MKIYPNSDFLYENLPKLGFWYENIASGNIGSVPVRLPRFAKISLTLNKLMLAALGAQSDISHYRK